MGAADQASGQMSKLIAIIDDDESMQDSPPGLNRVGWTGGAVLWIGGRLPRIRFAPSSRVPDN